jgi:hypothetical protein
MFCESTIFKEIQGRLAQGQATVTEKEQWQSMQKLELFIVINLPSYLETVCIMHLCLSSVSLQGGS